MITYLKGDATNPQDLGNKAIVHICNDRGGWGAGFVLALSKNWYKPEMQYRAWSGSKTKEYCHYGKFELGNVSKIQVEPDIWVFNMIAQKGYKSVENKIPLQYYALESCLTKVAEETKKLNASIHMPQIGCGLAGGDWNEVEEIINEICEGINVYVYDL